jgi:hypothetical protein
MEGFPNTQYSLNPHSSDRNWVLNVVQPQIGISENLPEESSPPKNSSVLWKNGRLIPIGISGSFYIISAVGKIVHKGVFAEEEYPLPHLSAGVYQLITESGIALSLVVPIR